MPLTDSHERYVNFYTDFAFKKLFGTEMNKILLISFLNELLRDKEVITDLTYLNVEHLGANAANRKAVFDVYCETQTGEKILVEMQKAEQEYFIERSIYYSTFPIQEQATKGDWNFELKRVYTIGILNFIFDKENADDYNHVVKLVEVDTGSVFYDKLTYIYLEMPKFRKTEEQLESLFEKWLYVIRNLSSLMERPAALQEAVFARLFEQAEIGKFTPTELYDYRESQKDYWDFFSVTQTAENKGRAEGLQQGLEQGLEQGLQQGLEQGLQQGLQQGIIESARKMIAAGIDRNVVISTLNISPEIADTL